MRVSILLHGSLFLKQIYRVSLGQSHSRAYYTNTRDTTGNKFLLTKFAHFTMFCAPCFGAYRRWLIRIKKN